MFDALRSEYGGSCAVSAAPISGQPLRAL